MEHKKIDVKWVLYHLPELIAGIALAFAIMMAGLTAFSRYVFSYTYGGNDELTAIAFVWAVFMGTAAAYREKAHYGIDLLVGMLPGKMQGIVVVIAQVIVVAIMAILTYLSVNLMMSVKSKVWTFTQISYVWSDLALVLGFGMMTFWSAKFLVDDIKAVLHPGKEEE